MSSKYHLCLGLCSEVSDITGREACCEACREELENLPRTEAAQNFVMDAIGLKPIDIRQAERPPGDN